MAEVISQTKQSGNKLKLGIIFSGLILALEVAGGLLSNSLALLGDAGHMLTDIAALSLSWYGLRQAERPSSSRMTFGYHRVGVVVAVVNALGIFAIAAVILYQAYLRLRQPSEVNSLLMLAVAFVGLGINMLVAFWLRTGQKRNINIRSAFWHALGDALASLGVIIGGAIMALTGWYLVDPIISIVICVVLVFAAWGILRQGLRVLLEATPESVDAVRLVEALERVPGVKGVHHVHVWSITPERHAMSCHVLVDDLSVSQSAAIREGVEKVAREQFAVDHTTLQMECRQCNPGDVFCNLESKPGDKKDG